MIHLVTLLAIVPLLGHSLKCLEGTDGSQLTEVQKEETADDKYMCMYEPKNPCTFDEPAEYGIYRYDEWLASSCWTLERAVCFCAEDLCNKNFQLLLEHWEAAPNENETLKDCVKKHFQDKISSSPSSTTGATGSDGQSDGTNPSGEPATGAEGDKSSSSATGDQGTDSGSGSDSDSGSGSDSDSGSGSGSGSTNPTEVSKGSTGDPASNQGSGSDVSGDHHKDKKKDDYDWTLFIILAIIAAILIFIIIPILLIMVIAKYSKAKKSSRKGASSSGEGEDAETLAVIKFVDNLGSCFNLTIDKLQSLCQD
ncbi:hypothetical protein RB195_015915 [Necator americanus]|uniref:Uncharacterized protein n=1 Tax=Necator americanus TaxID=51031 RepID=A0ABR1E8N4_NECAM